MYTSDLGLITNVITHMLGRGRMGASPKQDVTVWGCPHGHLDGSSL